MAMLPTPTWGAFNPGATLSAMSTPTGSATAPTSNYWTWGADPGFQSGEGVFGGPTYGWVGQHGEFQGSDPTGGYVGEGSVSAQQLQMMAGLSEGGGVWNPSSPTGSPPPVPMQYMNAADIANAAKSASASDLYNVGILTPPGYYPASGYGGTPLKMLSGVGADPNARSIIGDLKAAGLSDSQIYTYGVRALQADPNYASSRDWASNYMQVVQQVARDNPQLAQKLSQNITPQMLQQSQQWGGAMGAQATEAAQSGSDPIGGPLMALGTLAIGGLAAGAIGGGGAAAAGAGAGAGAGGGAGLTAAELYGSIPASYSLPAADLAAMGGTAAATAGAGGAGLTAAELYGSVPASYSLPAQDLAAAGGGLSTTVGGVPIEQAAAPVSNALGINYAGSSLLPAPSNLATYLTGSPTIGNIFGSTNAVGLGSSLGGGMGEWSNLLNLGSGLYGLYLSNQQRQLAQQAAGMQDPFGPYRGQYAQELSALMADPSKITSYPGYEAGIQGVNRGMAASGYLGSGNQMIALQKYAGDFYQQAIQELGTLAGAGFAPTGGQTLLTGTNQANQLVSSSLGTLGYGITMPQLYATLLANRTGA